MNHFKECYINLFNDLRAILLFLTDVNTVLGLIVSYFIIRILIG